MLSNSSFDEHAPLVLSQEFVLIPVEDGVLIDGGRELQVLTGPLALSLLPVLLPNLKVPRSFADLVALTPQNSVVHTREVIRRLLSWGVLSLGDRANSCTGDIQSTLSFLKRSDREADLELAYSALSNQKIKVVFTPGSELVVEELLPALESNGFSHLSKVTSAEFAPSAVDEDSFLISVTVAPPALHLVQSHYAKLVAAKASWLRTLLDLTRGYGETGPLMRPGTNLCLTCLTLAACQSTHASPITQYEEYPIWAAMVASDATTYLIRHNQLGPRSFRRYQMPLYQHQVKTWPSAVTCIFGHRSYAPATSSLFSGPSSNITHNAVFSDARSLLPFVFEEVIARRNEILNELRDPSLPQIATASRLMLNSLKIPLPQVNVPLTRRVLDLLFAKPSSSSLTLDLTRVATLLALSVGIRSVSEDSIRRWAPSGGNLGSAEAFLVANRIAGLEAGVYFYEPEHHRLAKLNHRGCNHIRAALDAMSASDLAPAHLVLTSAYGRTARKYGPFAYKLTHLDAGAAASQCHLVANALQVPIDTVQFWNAKTLGDALALRPLQEYPTHVFRLGVSTRRSSPIQRITRGKRSVSRILPSEAVAELTPEVISTFSSEELVEKLMEANTYVSQRLPPDIEPLKRFRLSRLLRRLPGACRTEESLGAALTRRSSIRQFSGNGPTKSTLLAILQAALSNNAFADASLSISVLVQGSPDLPSGIYSYDPKLSLLNERRSPFSRRRSAQLFFSANYEDTPIIIWLSADIRRAASGGNAAFYQTLLVRAGFLAHRLWMASLGMGLSGALIAGISSEATVPEDELIDPHHTSLIAFLCGWPASSGSET